MKKIALSFIFLLLLVVGITYVLLFTPLGNSFLRPLIQDKINQNSPVQITLSEFLLNTEQISIVLQLDDANSVTAQGNYSLFSQSFDIDYRVSLQKLSKLSELVQRKLSGKLLSDGNIKGTLELFKIKGKSDIAQSQTDYALIIRNKELDKAALRLTDVHLETLLSMLGEKPYAQGKVDLKVQLNDLNPQDMQGNVILKIKEAKLDAKTLKREFNLILHKTTLEGDFKAGFKGSKINYLGKLDSELLQLNTEGKIDTSDTAISSSYAIDIKELALLKSITNAPFRGPLTSSGTVLGNKKEMLIKGNSKLADSTTSYRLRMKEFKVNSLDINMKKAGVSKLLYLLGKPSYAQGKLDATIKLDSIASLQGNIDLHLAKGIVNQKVIKKHFDLNLPYIKFELTSKATLQDNQLKAKTNLNSTLATLKMEETLLDVETASLKSDYQLFVPSLKTLEPLLDRKLYGKLKVQGEIKKDKTLRISAHSNIFHGQLNTTILDEKINSEFKNLRALEILKMLGYPQVIDAPLNGTLVYDTKVQKGKLTARFDKAVLTASEMTKLVGNLTHTDLTKERFNEGSLISLINKEIITSDLQMKSKKASISSKKFIINSKKQLIDARVALKVKKYPAEVLLKGNIHSPHVKLDAKSMITPEIKEKVGKEINRFLKKLF